MENPSTSILICRSNPVTPDPRVEKEAASLVGAGYQVNVIGWDRSAYHPVDEHKDGYKIHRIPILSHYGMGLGNFTKLAKWQVRLLGWLYANRKEYDVLHACDFDTVLPCLVMKMIFGKKLVYDIFDFYPDHLRNTPLWVKQTIRRLDYWIINMADAVILVDDARREQIKETRPRRLFIIYNSPQDSTYNYSVHISSLKGGLHLTYVGLFQKERGLLEVISLLNRHPEWTLDMAGFGGDEEAIYKACKDIPNIHWHGQVDYDKALHLSSQADVLFATYDPSIPNHRYSSPNKLFEAMMLGKPIIVARDTNMDKIVSENDCGIVVTYGGETELEEALLKLANDPGLRKWLGENARKAYETNYSWNIMKARLIELYSQIRDPYA